MRARYKACEDHGTATQYKRLSNGLIVCGNCDQSGVFHVLGYHDEDGKYMWEAQHGPFPDLDKSQLPSEADEGTVDLNHRFKGYEIHEALLHSGYVRRYHTHPYLIGQQSVAEHTFRCMALMVSLWPEHTFQALKMMLFHDGAEGVVGDISSTVKKMYPGLGAVLDNIEDHVMVSCGMYVEEDQDEETRRWVRICDWLEGCFFAIDQIAMGNNGMIICHNAYVYAINKLDMPTEDRIKIKLAHHKYLRDARGVLKVDLGKVELLSESGTTP